MVRSTTCTITLFLFDYVILEPSRRPLTEDCYLIKSSAIQGLYAVEEIRIEDPGKICYGGNRNQQGHQW